MLYHTLFAQYPTAIMAAVFKSPERSTQASLLDRAGICVSVLCLVQCLALSLVIVLAPVVSLGVFGSDLFHRLLLSIILPIGVAAFWMGYRRHGSLVLLLTGLAGLALVLAAAVLEATVLSPLAASAITSVGGVTLIVAHWLNLRRGRAVCLQPAR